MIFLHGGVTPEMLTALLSGTIAGLIVFIALHIVAIKSKFYKTEFKNFHPAMKVVSYVLFFFVNVFLSYISALLFGIAIAVIFL